MRNACFILIAGLFLPLSAAAQQRTYKGVVVDNERKPVELFSVMVTNAADTTKQLFAETFVGGNFEFTFTS